jgi:uroporphyrin-III C-methyltransferase
MLALCPQATLVAVGKRCGKLSSAQQFINKRLVDATQKHKVIVRLKGGDPMLFGRADEEIQALKAAGIEVEVVPGITAALAGAASIGQSLTLRGVSRSVAFITLAQGAENLGHSKPISNPSADTLVYYMGRKDATKIAQQLISQGPHSNNTPVQILEAVSTPKERLWVSSLGEMALGRADQWFDSNSPALIMVGEALRVAQTLEQNVEQTLLQTSKSTLEKILDTTSPKIDDGLQNSSVLTNGRRRA